ncbi:MAG: adenosylmethionine--8-amino-7-oxononanoate transaminase [Corynebacterium sp.]|nr:adenosylmethionine--8-amino-7-oxononanoate transaminase [Corynebacterium sp.]
MDSGELRAIDAAHIWHPYAAPGADTIAVESTAGVYLTLAPGQSECQSEFSGAQVIDGMSSWWAACFGHSHPRLVKAATDQIDAMSHVMFGGLTHKPAAKLTKNLMGLTKDKYAQVFYSDSGSVAVEVAMKMALQYARGQGHPERTKFLTWRSGYHGDTFATMSVCDPEGGMHAMWSGVLSQQIFAPPPPASPSSQQNRAAYIAAMAGLIDDSVAAIIIEPGVQGAGGMRFHDVELVADVAHLAKSTGRLLIADEIATGFGRTGSLFVTLDAGIVPDILCLGKALVGGFMSLAASLATAKVAQGMEPKALLHGPTFCANPLGCAVAAEATAMIAEGTWRGQVAGIDKQLRSSLEPAWQISGVADVRVRGAIAVIEMDTEVDMPATTRAALSEGVWLRPYGKLIYSMPPYICTPVEVERIATAMMAAARAYRGEKSEVTS